MPRYLTVTNILILANLAIYLIELSTPEWMIVNFALWPLSSSAQGQPPFEFWQLISYSFLHDWQGWTHIILNMWGLFMFGSDLERVLGVKRYLGLYFTAVLTAALTQLAFNWFGGLPPTPTVGASGAVFGILLGFAIYFPDRTIVPLIPPIPMPARVFVVIYAAIELLLGVTGTQQGVAHFAHLGGLIGALFFLRRPGRRSD